MTSEGQNQASIQGEDLAQQCEQLRIQLDQAQAMILRAQSTLARMTPCPCKGKGCQYC